MTDEPPASDPTDYVSAYFPLATVRTNETTLSTRLALRDGLRDGAGALRMGAATFAVDVATGLASGVVLLDRNLWVVTTDLDVHVTAPVTVGPLRVEVEVLRAGATTVVAAFTLLDEGRGRPVGGGTATSRPFPANFDRSRLAFPIGEEFSTAMGGITIDAPIGAHLGFAPDEDGSVEVAIDDRVRNPWGILHGGVTACLVDASGELAGSAAVGGPVRVASQMVRYLAPGRVGPVRAEPRLLATQDGRALVDVRVVDTGAAGRLIAVGSVTAIAV